MNDISAEEVKVFPHELKQGGGFMLHYMMLYSIIYGMEAKKVFEFGCGYSSRVILEALKHTGGTLTTAEKRDIKDTGNNPEMIDKAKGQWRYIQKLSGNVIKEDVKGEAYEVVLHDGAHEALTVMRDIRGIVRHMKQDALLLVHDTNHRMFPYLKLAIRLGLFPYRYEMLTIPYGYGLTVIKLKSNLGNGRVELSRGKQ